MTILPRRLPSLSPSQREDISAHIDGIRAERQFQELADSVWSAAAEKGQLGAMRAVVELMGDTDGDDE